MARGRKTPEYKKEAIRAVLAVNPEASSKEIAKVVDLPDSTVRTILPEIMSEDEFNEYRQQQKKKAIQTAWEIATMYMQELLKPEKAEKASAKDAMIVVGTAIDKAQLLAGEPTQITERKEPTPELINELQQKVIELRKLTGT